MGCEGVQKKWSEQQAHEMGTEGIEELAPPLEGESSAKLGAVLMKGGRSGGKGTAKGSR